MVWMNTETVHRAAASELQPGVSVVVPVFNSENTLATLTREVTQVLEDQNQAFEILLVNDGSRDGSWHEIERLVGENPRVHGVNLSRNFGQHSAKLCGLRLASYDVTVTMDDDLQHPPTEIPKLLSTLCEDCDVVFGVSESKKHFWLRNLLTRITKGFVSWVTVMPHLKDQSPFRAFRTDLRVAFADYNGPDVLLDALLSWGTSRFCKVTVEHRPRKKGTSNYTVRRLFEMGILSFTAYSTGPLRLASWIGFGLTLFGLGILTYVVILALFIDSVPGFPFLASLISIFSGTQLFTLGLFGEYLTRVFNRALGRPAYVIRETCQAQLRSTTVKRSQ